MAWWQIAASAAASFLADQELSEDPELETRKLPTKTKKQRDALAQLIDELGGGTVDAEGISDRELSTVEDILGRVSDRRDVTSSGADRLEELLGSREEFDEFFRTNIEQPTTEHFKEEIIPGIGARFGGAGFFSSERRDAEQGAMEELAQELTAGRSRAAIEAPIQATRAIGPLLQAEEGLDSLALDTSGFQRRVKEKQRQRDIENVLASLGIDTFENIAAVKPGRDSGILGGFASGVGSALGGSL